MTQATKDSARQNYFNLEFVYMPNGVRIKDSEIQIMLHCSGLRNQKWGTFDLEILQRSKSNKIYLQILADKCTSAARAASKYIWM